MPQRPAGAPSVGVVPNFVRSAQTEGTNLTCPASSQPRTAKAPPETHLPLCGFSQVRKTFFAGAPFGCLQSVSRYFLLRSPLLPGAPLSDLLSPGSLSLSDAAGSIASVHPGRGANSTNYAQIGRVFWDGDYIAAGVPPLAGAVPSVTYRYVGGSSLPDMAVFAPLYLFTTGGTTVAYPTFSIVTGGVNVSLGDWTRSCPLLYTTYPPPAENPCPAAIAGRNPPAGWLQITETGIGGLPNTSLAATIVARGMGGIASAQEFFATPTASGSKMSSLASWFVPSDSAVNALLDSVRRK